MSASKQFDEKAIALHRDLLNNRLTAPAQLAALLQPRLLRGLSRKFSNITDEHLVQTAVNDAIIYYLKSPNNFETKRSSLLNFVWQRANSNLLNLLKENTKQNKFVELDEAQTVYGSETSRDETIEEFLIDEEQNRQTYRQLYELLPNPVDQKFLELLMNGERETILFAAILGISDEPPEQQRADVKKHKDRIKKFIQRNYERQR